MTWCGTLPGFERLSWQGCGSFFLLVLSIWKGMMKAWPVLTLIVSVARPLAGPALRRAA